MRLTSAFAAALVALLAAAAPACAQPDAGPFVPHRGMTITTHFTNDLGRDADSTINIVGVSNEAVRLTYASTRGIYVSREIRMSDRESARTYVLGYAPRMPTVIEGTTSLGLSAVVLDKLRTAGRAELTLVYSERLDRIECLLETTGVDIKVPIIIDDRVADIPTVQANASCSTGNRQGLGTMIFASDVNNPLLIESNLKFDWERRRRAERITRVAAGFGLHADMEQALDTLGAYDVYGLHFDFDKAVLRPDTAQLVREIAVMLQGNPNWVIQIAGHTDAIGGKQYNLRLSTERARAVRQALIARGISPDRLKALGYGETRPKSDNTSLAGRAINRRVEFRRLDR